MTTALASTIDVGRLREVLGRRPGGNSVPAGAQPAAVLVALVGHPVPGVVLTRRADRLRQHAGQVAFPGGRIDPDDGSPEAAALREAQEEIGLIPADVQVLGRLPQLVTGTSYHVTPVVGIVRSGAPMVPAPDEVASIFVLSLDVLRDPASPIRHRSADAGRSRDDWLWPHHEHRIWGATAAILVELAAALAAC